tara:strand:+ start:8947 stop:9288 length:342 start_codon:yes stop_codon:yes gene_type:complete
MDFAFEKDWNKLVKMMMERFGEQPDVTSIVFAVGLQEVSQGPSEYKKDDKVNLIHVGVCTLLEPLGYYKTLGLDSDGWPHFERVGELPDLDSDEQELLLKRQLVDYFAGWIAE